MVNILPFIYCIYCKNLYAELNRIILRKDEGRDRQRREKEEEGKVESDKEKVKLKKKIRNKFYFSFFN